MTQRYQVKTLSKIFPKSKFDTDISTVAKRTDLFMKLWEDWGNNEVQLKSYNHGHSLMGSARVIGNTEQLRPFAEKNKLEMFQDYLIKGNIVRFKDSDMAFYFRLSI